MSSNNREQWLQLSIEHIKTLFQFHGFVIPQVKVSVGFPGGGNRRTRIGEYWTPKASDDKVGSIFISPTLDNGEFVLGVLVHELVHAVVGTEAGHGKMFKRCALKVGLEGKMKSTTSGPELVKYIQGVIANIGPYPHSKLNPNDGPTKKQSTRMVRQVCRECEYIVRSSQKCIDSFGPVICPRCQRQMEIG